MEFFLPHPIEVYDVFGYYRLSKEDGDKPESDSIKNQKDLIHSYIDQRPDLRFCMEKEDDGYTGTNFNRPGFLAMLDAIKEKKINCVIVKDLSRFGRDYIEAGRYIQRFFPFWGVRFIAINDNYDSLTSDANSNIIIPVKNLVNDSYCRDTSIKIRSTFEVKRKKGEFIGSFAAYGYKKLADDKNRLVIDEAAATVVRRIYNLFLDGMSCGSIAKLLNDEGERSPLEYKRAQGMKYKSGYKAKATAAWSAVGVRRILTNAVYIGTMEQGKRTTPNYKVKNVIYRPESEWDRVEGTHDAIIDKEDFELVGSLLKMDTKTAPYGKLYPLAGLVCCGDCKCNLVRKRVASGGKVYVYYLCSTNHMDHTQCSPHRIKEEDLLNAVLVGLNTHIKMVAELQKALHEIEMRPREDLEVQLIDRQIAALETELQKKTQLREALYRRYAVGEVSTEDFLMFKKVFQDDCEKLEAKIRDSRARAEEILKNGKPDVPWITMFLNYGEVTELTRTIAVRAIERIKVFDKKNISIDFRFQEKYQLAMEYLAIHAASAGVEREVG